MNNNQEEVTGVDLPHVEKTVRIHEAMFWQDTITELLQAQIEVLNTFDTDKYQQSVDATRAKIAEHMLALTAED